MKKLLSLVLFSIALTAGAETPNEGAKTILDLVKAKNYADLFKTRYAEWYKVEAEKADPQAAVEKLSKRWEKQNATILSIYEQLSTAEYELGTMDNPQVSETGEVATATVTLGQKKIPFKFYKMKSGLWGFQQ